MRYVPQGVCAWTQRARNWDRYRAALSTKSLRSGSPIALYCQFHHSRRSKCPLVKESVGFSVRCQSHHEVSNLSNCIFNHCGQADVHILALASPVAPTDATTTSVFCDTLTLCRRTCSSAPFDPFQIWITNNWLLWVALRPSHMHCTEDSLGYPSMMSQAQRILPSSTVRSIQVP